MYKYLLQKWKTKREYILALAGLLLVLAIKPSMYSSAGTGIFLGAILACILFLGPIVFVDVRQVRVKRPLPRYVEKAPWMILFWYIPSVIVIGVLVVLVLGIVPSFGDYVVQQMDADTFMGGLLMMFFMVSAFLIPVCVQQVFIKTRYKKIIEYGSAEWRRLHK